MEQILCKDIVLDMCKFIENEKDIIHFLSTCKSLHGLKNQINYETQLPIEKINHLWYRDRFTYLVIKIGKQTNQQCTQNLWSGIKKLVLMNYSGSTDFLGYSNITHLYLEKRCKIGTVNLTLPPKLVHLTWNIQQHQKFPTENLPLTLKELSVANYSYQELRIPESVTSLVIDKNCSFLTSKLPENLTELFLRSDRYIILPKNLKTLYIDHSLLNFPEINNTLYKLIIGENFSTTALGILLCPINIEILVLHTVVYTLSSQFPKLTKIFVKKNIINYDVTMFPGNLIFYYFLKKEHPNCEIIPF